MEALINVLVMWLSLSFGLPAAADHPQIRYVPPQRLLAIHSGTSIERSRDQTVVGAYDTLSGTIYLREDWDSRRAADVSVLVHELVHYLQHRASLRFECPAAREAPAYAAQKRWLELYGTDIQSAFGIDAMTLKLRTTCLPY